MNKKEGEEERVEEIKTLLKFDEQVARLYGLTTATVRDEYDATLVELIAQFVRNKR